jgi:hypothetical protein
MDFFMDEPAEKLKQLLLPQGRDGAMIFCRFAS